MAALGVQLPAAPIEAPEAEAPEAEPPAAPDAQPPMDELPNFSPTADGRVSTVLKELHNYFQC